MLQEVLRFCSGDGIFAHYWTADAFVYVATAVPHLVANFELRVTLQARWSRFLCCEGLADGPQAVMSSGVPAIACWFTCLLADTVLINSSSGRQPPLQQWHLTE